MKYFEISFATVRHKVSLDLLSSEEDILDEINMYCSSSEKRIEIVEKYR